MPILQNSLSAWWGIGPGQALAWDAGPSCASDAFKAGRDWPCAVTAISLSGLSMGDWFPLLLIRHFRLKGGYEEIHLDTPGSSGTGEPLAKPNQCAS